ncbi:MAG: class I SAM-dependent methyltransferase [Alphaproteobacteria bacterium]|nr:class I SAM-dependent methyltransferase [Alphaproteobacteria bacterium]
MKIYMEPVGEILRDVRPRTVLDLPSGSGWLGGLVPEGAAIDGIDLYAPKPPGYREFRTADLDAGIPDGLGTYDAIVSCEGIEHLGNPLAFLRSAAEHLNPGGTMVVTTPNIWYPEAKLKFLFRGFFPGFPSLAGQIASGHHMHIAPWSFPWLYLYLSLAGFGEIRLHDLDQPKPKHRWSKIFGLPQARYCRRKAEAARSAEERQYWLTCASDQSVFGRNLVVSAVKAP